MKKYLIGLELVMANTAANANCNSTSCGNTNITSWTTYSAMAFDPNCATPSSSPTCFQNSNNSSSGIKIYSCSKCITGYDLTYDTTGISTTCGNAHTTKCTKCTGCSNCNSTGWASDGTGYESRIVRTCSCNTCTSSTQYRCARGYYGTPAGNTSGCNRCPASGGVYGTTDSAGSTDVTKCYLPTDTAFSDGTGSGTYTGKCFFSVP